MTRANLSGRASVIVFVASALVSLAGSSAAAQSNPSATLIYRTTVDLVETTDATLVILAAGPAPEQGEVLVTDDGGATVGVEILDLRSRDCLAAPVLNSGLGPDRWCVHLTGIKAGQAFKGQLVGPSSTVTLTVAARDKLVFPIVFAAAALLLSIGLLLLTTKALPWLVATISLAGIKNDGLVGLTEWVKTARIHLSPQDTLARVRWAQTHGKRQLTAIRVSLQARIAASTLPTCPLRNAARTEAARQDFAVADLLTERGTAATSKAERLTSLIVQSDKAMVDFRNISSELVSLTTGSPNHVLAQALMDRGNALADDYLAEFTYEPFVKKLQDLLGALRSYVPPGPKPLAPHVVQIVAGTADMAMLGVRITPAIRRTLSFGVVLLAAIPLMAVAVVIVLSTQYFPNQTFGSFADYVGLVAAMLGSSSAIGILTVLLLLRSPQEWYG